MEILKLYTPQGWLTEGHPSHWDQFRREAFGHRVSFLSALAAPLDSADGFCLAKVQQLSQTFLEAGIRDVLWVGIGGSSLGSRTIVEALQFKRSNSLRFHFLESPDYPLWRTLRDQLRPATTLIVCVSKSGETFETLEWLNLLLSWMPAPYWSSHCVAVTDAHEGPLRQWATANSIVSLPIARPVGGRFSVWTPVGSFALSLAGLNPEAFWNGSQAIVQATLLNQASALCFLNLVDKLCALQGSHRTHVLMPYSARLKTFSEWWVQLWAESLGKNGSGFYPLASLGPHDQHSMMQLLLDGPDQAVVGFVTTGQNGGTEAPLIDAAFRGTRDALQAKGRPWFHVETDSLDETVLGALMTQWALMTAYAGTVLGIHAFDQPAVGAIKDGIRKSLPHLANSHIAPYTESHAGAQITEHTKL